MKYRSEIIGVLIAAIAISGISYAQVKGKFGNRPLAKTETSLPNVLMNGNNVTCWVRSDGFFPALVGQSWNGEFPKGSGVGTIYQEGIVFGGFVSDGLYSETLRVNGNTYFTGMQPGAIQSDASGKTIGADNPNDLSVRAFGVRPDLPPTLAGDTLHWPNLNSDAASFFQKSVDSVTAADRQQIASQYFKDWTEWPAKKGAPWFVDNIKIVRHDGAFDPTNPHHIPGIPEAAKTIWFVSNDLSQSIAAQFAASPPMGVEEQMTLWAYSTSGTLDPMNDIIYKQVKLIYKGNIGAPADSRIDSMYVGQWSDPDVGYYGDDLIGCDSLLNLGFAYNSKVNDSLYALAGLQNPSVAYMLLQGTSHFTGNHDDSAVVNFQWRKGYKYWTDRPLSSFLFPIPVILGLDDIAFSAASSMWYNLLRGCLPRPVFPISIPYYTSSPYALELRIATLYAYPGDPVTRSGWIDGIDLAPADRRMLSNQGPFSLVLHDTAEVVIALVDALGGDNKWSVEVLKYNASFARYSFNSVINPSTVSASVESLNLPISFNVNQNFPNPFNPSTSIQYQIPTASRVTIRIYNVLGQEVATLVDEQKQAGVFNVQWNAANVPSGIYFYSTVATPIAEKMAAFRDVKKMVLLK